jgi:hypothetical protein
VATKRKGDAEPAKKKRRSANVPGQFYGYSLQITRVVAHFLRAHRGESVSIEHLDDVARHGNNSIVAEQDKSGLAHNPVADRSPELWKTLASWVRAIRAGALMSNTRFLLYVAQGHRGDVIDSIHAASNKADADALVLSLRKEFWGTPPKYSTKNKLPSGLAEHVNDVLSASNDVLASLFLNITLENGSGAPNDDLAGMPGMAAISQERKEDVVKFLLGWAKKAIDKRIEERRAAVITWDEFHKQFVAAARRFDRAENVLIPTPMDVTEPELQRELRDRTYVRQLEAVSCDDGDLVQAVNDFLRSAVHRTVWSEDGDVIERSFGDFEDSLDRAWKTQRAVVAIEQKSLTEEERGRLLYARCQQLQIPLQGKEVPTFFVPGSFHAMADSLRVGWHPRYHEVVLAPANPNATNNEGEAITEPAVESACTLSSAASTPELSGFGDEGDGA